MTIGTNNPTYRRSAAMALQLETWARHFSFKPSVEIGNACFRSVSSSPLRILK